METNMKKYFLLTAIVMALVGCTNRQSANKAMADEGQLITADEFEALIDQARWSDVHAYLKLADCYRDGQGVEKDFMGMLSMLIMAEEYGGRGKLAEYRESMPESEFKWILEASELYEQKRMEEGKEVLDKLTRLGSPEDKAVEGLATIERGDTLVGKRLLKQAASKGSTIAELKLCKLYLDEETNPDMEWVQSIVDKAPIFYNELAMWYLDHVDDNTDNDSIVASCYMKADKYACLSQDGARWLWGYWQCVSIDLPSQDDLRRMKFLFKLRPPVYKSQASE